MLTCAVAEVGKTRMCVAVASRGVESAHCAAEPPNRSSGVYWSDMTRSTPSGSRDTRHTDRIVGTSDFHVHSSCNTDREKI